MNLEPRSGQPNAGLVEGLVGSSGASSGAVCLVAGPCPGDLHPGAEAAGTCGR